MQRTQVMCQKMLTLLFIPSELPYISWTLLTEIKGLKYTHVAEDTYFYFGYEVSILSK